MSLTGKRVLITGAARGIGAETARQAARRGARIALVGLERERMEALASELGTGHVVHEADVRDTEAVAAAVDAAAADLGGLDVVMANAGISNYGTLATAPAEDLLTTIDVNLGGVVRTASAAVAHLERSRGYLLLVASVSGLAPAPGMAAYTASKAGTDHFGRAIRMELAHRGVDVGVLYPSWVDTDLVRDTAKDVSRFDEMRSRLPWPLRTTTSVQACGTAVVSGIEARSARINVPGAVRLVHAARAIIASSRFEAKLARDNRDITVAMEAEYAERGLGFSEATARLSAPRSTVRD